ncbi:MAG TPA: hotdog domain-containing protein [Hyphomicrobiaceae bacterium]|nr:hotdog domain-containing protein [Hyphomicrobiaceae bacterium]
MFELDAVTVGLVGTARIVVAAEHTAARVGSGVIAVLATPVMINLIEAAALAAAEHLLPPGHQSLGTRLDVSHTAATPIGGLVTATARVTAVAGREVTFAVEARDDLEVIAQGVHTRVVVNVEKFENRVRRKANNLEAVLGASLGRGARTT